MYKVGVATKPYLPSIHLFDFYKKKFKYRTGDFPVSEMVSKSSIALPLYIGLTERDIEYISEKVVKIIKSMTNEFKDKVILITGGAGSIGSALVREILKYDIKTVRILDSHEFSLHKMECSLSEEDRKKARFFLGDVRDRYRLQTAMNGVDIVYHAAAYKHVHFAIIIRWKL